MQSTVFPSPQISFHFPFWGTWVAQLIRRPTSAQVMILRFVGLSPTLGSLLSAQSPLQILCPPLSLFLPCSLSLSLSFKGKHFFLKERIIAVPTNFSSVPTWKGANTNQLFISIILLLQECYINGMRWCIIFFFTQE